MFGLFLDFKPYFHIFFSFNAGLYCVLYQCHNSCILQLRGTAHLKIVIKIRIKTQFAYLELFQRLNKHPRVSGCIPHNANCHIKFLGNVWEYETFNLNCLSGQVLRVWLMHQSFKFIQW